MSNEHVMPGFTEIVDGFMKMRAYAPVPECTGPHEWIGTTPYCSACGVEQQDASPWQVPTTTTELAQLMGGVYRDAHSTGYGEGYAAGVLQASEDAEQAAYVADEDNPLAHMVIKYAELWAESRRAISNMECVIRQLAEMDNGQIKATLQGTVWCLQAQLDKGDS